MSSIQEYRKTYTSYAGTDIVATVTMPPAYGGNSYVLGELQTISVSVHRDVAPVKRLGQSGAAGFTSGYRTIAGSMIFTVFNNSIVHTLKNLIYNTTNDNGKIVYPRQSDTGSQWFAGGGWNMEDGEARNLSADSNRRNSIKKNTVLMDELPPFDVNIIMKNEYGQSSYLTISGIVIVDEGQVMSIEDLLVENTYSYMAQYYEPLRPYEV